MTAILCETNGLTSEPIAMRAKSSLAVPIFAVAPRPDGILLDSNEFRFPLPKRFLKRVADELWPVDLRCYPDFAEVEKIKVALARDLGVEPDNLLLGVGSTELLDLISRAFGERDHRIVTPIPSFPMYAHYANLNDRKFVPVPLDDDLSLSSKVAEALLREPGSKSFYVCSPNNPTGLSIERETFDALASDPRAILCLDEAYAEYSGRSFVTEAATRDNVVVTRSFSKIGLAGCRFGYAVASKNLIRELAKAALPYALNSLTLRIAQIFIEEMPLIRAVVEDVKRERARLSTALANLPGFRPYRSDANFLLCAAPGDAAALARRLIERRKIWVRPFSPQSRLRDCLRIAVGSPEDNDILLDALRQESTIHAPRSE